MYIIYSVYVYCAKYVRMKTIEILSSVTCLFSGSRGEYQKPYLTPCTRTAPWPVALTSKNTSVLSGAPAPRRNHDRLYSR